MPHKIINKECIYCNKVIKYDTSWYKHLNGKRHLKNVDEYNSEQKVNTSEQKVNTSEQKVNTSEQKVNTKVNISEQKVNISEQKVNTSEQKVNIKKFMCEYCNKKFTTATSRYRHIRNYCKQKNNNIINNTINTTTNNTTNNNTMNIDNKRIININNYGSED